MEDAEGHDPGFTRVRASRSDVCSVLEEIEQRAAAVKEAYEEVASTHAQGPSLLGLDSLYFQHQLITMELGSLREMLRVVSNRQYCEYYHLHQEVQSFLASTTELRHLKCEKTFPVYQELKQGKSYDFAQVIELHREVCRVIGEMRDFASAKARDLAQDTDKLSRGLNIGNLVNTCRYSNAVLLERAKLFRASVDTFHAQHRKYLGRLLGKASLVRGALDEDVREPKVTPSPPPMSPRQSEASSTLPVHLDSAKIGDSCEVDGYDGEGVIRFIGIHAEKRGQRVGVEFNRPIGRNNGTIGGHTYFTCPDSHGVLVVPSKVQLKLKQCESNDIATDGERAEKYASRLAEGAGSGGDGGASPVTNGPAAEEVPSASDGPNNLSGT